jgi:acyl-CoA reductase-like NAD-dependent aldehyde dehydrogenase
LTTVLQALRVLFEAHDKKKSLADEHLICTSQKTLTRHVPLGNILILAEAGSPLAQSIIPLCLAVAEGNSALVILSHAAPETSAILLEIINENTDQDAIVAIKPESSSDSTRILGIFEKVAWHGIFVQSNSSKAEIEGLGFQQSSLSVRLLFQPPRNSIVIVTRNADIQKTARHIAMGKFSFFAGKSVVAPALVLVDEFVIVEFLSALESCIRGIIVGRPPRMKARKQVLQPETSRALNHFVNGAGGKGGYAIQISPGGSEETLLIGPQEWR